MTKSEAVAKPRLGRPPATDSAETRRRILDLARLAFAARGYSAATNRNLGAEAGLTSGAIYHYFGSKLDLYLAVHDDAQDRVYSRFSEAVGRADTFRGQFEAVLEAAHDMNAEDPTLAQFLGSLRVDTRRNPELRTAFARSASTRVEFFGGIVDVGVATGEIDPADREIVNALVLTILIGLTDAVSGNNDQHRRAVDGIKALLEGKLIRPAPDRPVRNMKEPRETIMSADEHDIHDRDIHDRDIHDRDIHDRDIHDRDIHDRDIHDRDVHDYEDVTPTTSTTTSRSSCSSRTTSARSSGRTRRAGRSA